MLLAAGRGEQALMVEGEQPAHVLRFYAKTSCLDSEMTSTDGSVVKNFKAINFGALVLWCRGAVVLWCCGPLELLEL